MELVATVLTVIWLGVLGMSGYALVHAGLQRADAFPAADKMTKNTWLAILGGAFVGAMLLFLIGMIVVGTVIAAVASGVYLVDVRPKVLDVQGKSR